MLVDTSVWIEYFRRGNGELARLLERGAVLTHPFVIGELACGRFRDRRAVFALLGELPPIATVDAREALAFLERHELAGRGVGWIDIHLLASARLAGATFWTRDGRLATLARELGLHTTDGD
jgi:hypothetical protein